MLIVADCLTGEDTWHVASLASREKSKTPLIVVCVDYVGRVWWRGCNYRWEVRLHGRMHGADGIWLLAVLSSLIMCIDQTYCYLSHKYHWGSFYNHFSLCTEMVQKLHRNGPSSCTKVVRADSACSSCTEIGLYRSRPPLVPKWSCTELVLSFYYCLCRQLASRGGTENWSSTFYFGNDNAWSLA